MSMFCPLASGSKGNCLYIGTEHARILIDAGLSARATVQRLETIGLSIHEIDAIFITHEHTDHILGLKVLALKYGIPVFANHETARGIAEALGACPKFKIFSTGEAFSYLDLHIHPFSIPHDTPDPVAFTIETGQIKLGICADLGFATTLVQHHLMGCNYLYLEANHEPARVHASARPATYKQRVLGRTGHLSNGACGDLVSAVYHPGLKHVHLAHLSSECNDPELAFTTVSGRLKQANQSAAISIAWQDKVSHPVKLV